MWLEILLPAMLGGCLAGVVALAVGGVGGMLQTRRAVTGLADIVGDLQVQVTREVKRRAGESRKDPLVEALAASRIDDRGGGLPNDTPQNGAQVLARARRLGQVR